MRTPGERCGATATTTTTTTTLSFKINVGVRRRLLLKTVKSFDAIPFRSGTYRSELQKQLPPALPFVSGRSNKWICIFGRNFICHESGEAAFALRCTRIYVALPLVSPPIYVLELRHVASGEGRYRGPCAASVFFKLCQPIT